MNPKTIFIFSSLLLISFSYALTSCTGPTEKLYIEKCSDCHGKDGTGGKANIDFTRQKFSPEKIKYSILHGKGEMAKIPEIKETELTQLVNYVASLYTEN